MTSTTTARVTAASMTAMPTITPTATMAQMNAGREDSISDSSLAATYSKLLQTYKRIIRT